MHGTWALFEAITRLLGGGLLMSAGIWKLSSTWAWRQLWLASYQMLPSRLVAPVALLLPVAELASGIAVVLGALGPHSLWTAAAIYGLFTLAAASVAGRGLTVPCGCLPWLETMVSWRVVLRNLLLMTALVAIAWHGLSAPSVNRAGWNAEVLVMIGGVGAALASVGLLHSWQRHRLIAAVMPSARARLTGTAADTDVPTVTTPAETALSG